jgi:hypothetical protein
MPLNSKQIQAKTENAEKCENCGYVFKDYSEKVLVMEGLENDMVKVLCKKCHKIDMKKVDSVHILH